jgi:predicted HicB family RNase H-like nuclease
MSDAGILSKHDVTQRPFQQGLGEAASPPSKSGTVPINVRVAPDLHKRVKDHAYRSGVSMQALVTHALEQLVGG